MKKKFCLGLLITCLLLSVLGFCTESYAYTFDDFIEFIGQVKDLNYNASWNYYCNTILNNQNNLRNAMGDNYVSFVVHNSNNTSGNITIRVWSSAMTISVGYANGGGYINCGTPVSTKEITLYQNGGYYVGNGTRQNQLSATNDFGLIETSSVVTNWYDLKFNNIYVPPIHFDFTQYGNVHNVTVGNYTDVSVIYYNPTTPIYWGILQNYNELDSNLLSYSLDIMTPDGNDEVLFDYVQWRLIDYGRYYWFTDSSKIYLNRVYKLLVNYDGAELVYTYYIAPYGSNYSTGDTIGYFYNSGDSSFDTQDATNTIVDALTDTQQIDATLDNLTSGEIYNKLGYTEYHTTWNNFMYDMFTGIETALFSSGDIAFTFPYMRTTITLHSSDFITPPGLLKGFCSSFLMFGFIVLVYQHIARFYHRLQEGAVNQVVEEFNVDDETLIL